MIHESYLICGNRCGMEFPQQALHSRPARFVNKYNFRRSVLTSEEINIVKVKVLPVSLRFSTKKNWDFKFDDRGQD